MNRIAMAMATGLVLGASAVCAQEQTCSNATLQGAYGVTVSGTAPAGTVLPEFPAAVYPPGTLQQIAGVVLHIFDGKGRFTQSDNVKGYLSGIIPDRPGGGTYTVNPDCTGTYTVLLPVHPFRIENKFVIVDGGREFRAVVVFPLPNMVMANGRKIH